MKTYVIGQVTTQVLYTEFTVLAESPEEAMTEFEDGQIQSVIREEVLDTLEVGETTIERCFD